MSGLNIRWLEEDPLDSLTLNFKEELNFGVFFTKTFLINLKSEFYNGEAGYLY